MNHELIIRMMKIKKQEYELFKEIVPERVRSRINNMETELVDIMKEFAFTEFSHTESECSGSTGQKNKTDQDENKVKKVMIES